MNVFEITEDKSNHSIWIFVVVSAVLMLFTVLTWTTWSRVTDDKQRRKDLRIVLNAGNGEA